MSDPEKPSPAEEDWFPYPIAPAAGERESFQRRVELWCLACFGPEITMDRVERNHRFLEESLELVQAIGCTQSEAHQLVDYVFSRPKGEPSQELGGVIVTLNALATAFPMPVDYCGEKELTRVWGKIDKVRAKQAAKPRHSPLPKVAAPIAPAASTEAKLTRAEELFRLILFKYGTVTPKMERWIREWLGEEEKDEI